MDKKTWHRGKRHLAASCPTMERLIAAYPGEGLTRREDGFYTLLRAIVGQQISVKAADAVWRRMEASIQPLTPQKIVRTRIPTLRALGLSERKAEYAKNIAAFWLEHENHLRHSRVNGNPAMCHASASWHPDQKIMRRRRAALDARLRGHDKGERGEGVKKSPLPQAGEAGAGAAGGAGGWNAYWHSFSDEEVITHLTRIKGVGRWTAEMFLIFHLTRTDVLPLKDLGLLKAIDVYYPTNHPRTPADYLAISEKWRPYRSIATGYLWRALDPVPVAY